MDRRGIEKACCEIVDNNINMLVPWYIMASYAYYVEDDPLLEDAVFDRLAKRLLESWDTVDHFHKDHLSVDMVKAGTYIGEYPSRVKGAVGEIKDTYRVKVKR